MDTVAVQSPGAVDTRARVTVGGLPLHVAMLMAASFMAVLIANARGISIGDDGVGYQAIADSLVHGNGYGYFLERPVTVWPPLWPALMALVAVATPLGTVGSAVLLNACVSAGVVGVGNRLLVRLVPNARLVLLGTVVMAIGPATIGLGHVLMTDMSFALVTLAWMLALVRFHESGALRHLFLAAALASIGFGLRYVGLTLIAFGGLWLLLDHRRRIVDRLRSGLVYGITASILPAIWMLRNHRIDGTFTGERHSSARGFVDNGFDLTATIGRFLIPGLGNGYTRIWSAVGVLVTLAALLSLWRVLNSSTPAAGSSGAGAFQPLRRFVELSGGQLGLVGLFSWLYLAYMLYVRTTTALNQLDLRLLFPAYFPLIIVSLAMITRLGRFDSDDRHGPWKRWTLRTAHLWAATNVVVGLVGMVAFAMGHSYFSGDYADEVFRSVRANPALDVVPEGCEVYSNLPNGLYPRLEAEWSPQRTALESTDTKDDLARFLRRSRDTKSCLVWIDRDPRYGHLWPLDELRSRLTLTELAERGDVSVFRIGPPT